MAKKWRIGVDLAKKTVNKTTQLAVRDYTVISGEKRLRSTAYQLKYPRKDVDLYCDILMGKRKSLLGNTCGAIYCSTFHWMRFYPIPRRADAHQTQDWLFATVGFP